MKRVFFIFFLTILIFSLTACSNANTPEIVVELPPDTVPTETAGTTSTVLAATATPIEALPTGSPTTPTSLPATAIVMATPTPSPTPTLSPTPSPALTPIPSIYVVEEYDTLLSIAIEFDTTTEAIIAANDIREEDFLQIGQELIIPTAAEATAIAAAADDAPDTAEPTPTSLPTSSADTPGQSDEDHQTPQTDTTTSPGAPPPAATAGGAPPPTISHPENINPLTGLPVDDPAVLRRRPIMVRIGNDQGARPQVGLNSADVVYEEITEWWVTRFTAIFLSQTPTTVAPIRSARLINVQLGPQYQGALAHSGGSDPVRWEISQAPIANLDEFYNAQPYFYRPNEGWQTRLAINTEAARTYMADNNLDAPVAVQGFLFSDTIEGGEAAENIFIAYPRATSFTQWSYDAASGQYLRYVDDQPLVDFYDGHVSANNVIIYFAEHQETDIVEDANGATSIRIIVNGTGPAWFFRDGKLNKGYWETDGSRTPYFAYNDGSPYHLKPGRTWVEVVPTYFTIGLNSADEASAK